MSLTVEIFLVRADGEVEFQATPEGVPDSAGPESWRTLVWGSRAIRSLGARFFPDLVRGGLVAPDETPAFLAECALVRGHLERLAELTCRPDRTVEQHAGHIGSRLATIEETALRAREMGGGVLIW
ncbi:hypothetical protein [Streptomyces sp. YS415]|uniref:hypothetical protein n=1 Tax=Streptomyces sp. YS415 TaxID=2944806 RepID=UPI00202109C3|nr:hypothetical protein [Streptomyces sp. YS415]MCL7424626.1 hypothetical protein [Streptomyces sp. YS415]